MSWGTCYTGSNNIHTNFPPIMNDGRNYANWQPGAIINERIRKEAHITSNWEYRKYLSANADTIIKHNQINACDDCFVQNMNSNGNGNRGGAPSTDSNTPYLYKSSSDNTMPYGYETSDLKNLYLGDVQLQSRMVTPVITQAEMIKNAVRRAN